MLSIPWQGLASSHHFLSAMSSPTYPYIRPGAVDKVALYPPMGASGQYPNLLVLQRMRRSGQGSYQLYDRVAPSIGTGTSMSLLYDSNDRGDCMLASLNRHQVPLAAFQEIKAVLLLGIEVLSSLGKYVGIGFTLISANSPPTSLLNFFSCVRSTYST